MAGPRFVVATETFACEVDGREVIVHADERLKSSDKVVKAHPDFFEPAAGRPS